MVKTILNGFIGPYVSSVSEFSSGSGPTRFVILGGFLGAGKTTLAINLGRFLKDKYKKSIAIITNDQGNVLVDTRFAEEAGFDVREVLGGCFCANFDEFVKHARTLVQMKRPDIIIAEPIGTSTNILATVVAPLRTLYPDEFEVAPLMVVVDATQASKLTGSEPGKVKLIPSHQVQEAEIIIVSKMDRIPEDERERTIEAIAREHGEAEIIPYSSVTGENLDKISKIILSDRKSTKVPVGADNSIFRGEKASLGWYSSVAKIESVDGADIYGFLTSIMRRIASSFRPEEIAHVKFVVRSPEVGVKMSLVGNSIGVDGLRGSRYLRGEGELVLNARVIAAPDNLSRILRDAVTTACKESGIKLNELNEKCFTPKPEAPSYFFKIV